jgi:hypothetical protein
MSQAMVPVFIVYADAGPDHKGMRLGMFFRKEDADKHVASLAPPTWGNARAVLERVALSDLHAAHACDPYVAAAIKAASAPTTSS